MKKKFALRLLGMLIVSTLIFAGCSASEKSISQNSSTVTSGKTLSTKDTKNITDNELINSSAEDTATQLDSVGNQSKQLSSGEVDLLLNDNITSNP